MESISNWFLYFLIGISAGLLSGMFGIGGGTVRTPLLYIAGLPLLSAIGINLIVIPFSSLTGAISHKKNIEWKSVRYIIAGGIIGTATGAFFIGYIETITLAVLFVIASIVTVLGIYFDRIIPAFPKQINTKKTIIVVSTFLLNLLTALRGGSGGSLFPPFLRMIGFDVRKAIATSLFATIFTAVAGAVVFWYRGDIVLVPALVVITGSIIGARIGSLISLKTKPLWLEIGLSIFVIIMAFSVLYKAMPY